MKRTGLVIVLLILMAMSITSCREIVRGPGKIVNYVDVALNTTDNLTLAASYYDSPAEKGLIFLHMMGKSRSSWKDLPDELISNYKILTIDFRGHGQSDGDMTKMVDKDFKNLTYDVAAAAEYLRWKGVKEKDISIVGASIGASAAYIYAQDHPVDKLVLVAPGGNLRGLDISRMSYGKAMFVQVGHYDAYASISVDSMEANWDRASVEVYQSSAHGSDLYFYDIGAREDLLFYLS